MISAGIDNVNIDYTIWYCLIIPDQITILCTVLIQVLIDIQIKIEFQ